ncbi:hypothetical protein CDV36_007257 [Fusarium kuroshium]|uniref:Uncharacterized protein n=1 Tax=Fusarium kuroshium TaxID=2010991 RepID=A0A3M2S6B1_9HYPO|nr:hypothetical protein CDV36_007257 [Fusarium kuroshium]
MLASLTVPTTRDVHHHGANATSASAPASQDPATSSGRRTRLRLCTSGIRVPLVSPIPIHPPTRRPPRKPRFRAREWRGRAVL